MDLLRFSYSSNLVYVADYYCHHRRYYYNYELVLSYMFQAISLHRDPTGKEIFSHMDPSKRSEKSEIKDNHNDMAVNLADLTDYEKVVLLNSQMARLKETLSDKIKRIAELESIINSTA